MKQRSPTCSVCIPTRDRPDYLKSAIESVLSQSFSDLELVISDNSTDERTGAVVESFHDDRIRYYRTDGNVELVDNWISVLSKTTGKYCAIMGDDDLLEREFLMRLLPPLEDDASIDLSFCDHRIIDSKGSDLPSVAASYSKNYQRNGLPAGRIPRFALLAIDSQSIPITASLMRRDSLLNCGGLNRGCGLVIDYYLTSCLALLGGAAHYIPDRLMAVRVHDKSASSGQAEQAWRDMQWCCGDLLKQTTNSGVQRALRRKLGMAIAQESISARHRGWSRVPGTAWRDLQGVPSRARAQVAGLVALYSFTVAADRLQSRLRGHP
jgi:glycosyltransferase involved in cell wall biosynthesis